MTSATEQQRFAAVLMARVDRYARLIAVDESSVRERLGQLRSEVVSPRIAAHGGRILASSGETILAEFGDSVEALRCAVKVQRESNRRETQSADDERIALRIGIDFDSVIGDEPTLQAMPSALPGSWRDSPPPGASAFRSPCESKPARVRVWT